MPQYRVILMPKYATNLSFVNAKVKQSALCYTCCKTIIIIHTCIQSYWWYPYILPAWIHADSQTSTDIVPLTIASFFFRFMNEEIFYYSNKQLPFTYTCLYIAKTKDKIYFIPLKSLLRNESSMHAVNEIPLRNKLFIYETRKFHFTPTINYYRNRL